MSARRTLLRFAVALSAAAGLVSPMVGWAAPTPPTVTKRFDGVTPAFIGVGATSRLTIAITNNDGGTVFNASFTDTYPAGLVNTATPNVTTSAGCQGTVTVTANAGAGGISLAGANTIASGATCTIGVDVTSSSSASYLNSVTVTVCGNLACPAAQEATGTGSARLNVVGRYKSVRVSTDADSSATATVGDTLEWSVFFHNPSGGSAIANFQATDAVGANTTVTATPTLTYTPGGCSTGAANGGFNGVGNTNLFAAAFTLNANCTVRADFRVSVGAAAGGTTLSDQASGSGTGLAAILTDNIDTTTAGLPAGVTPTAGSIAQTQTAAISATTVAIPLRPTITKSFSPTSIGTAATSTLTIVLGNGNATDLSVNTPGFTDTFPTSPGAMTVASPLATSNTCGGTLVDNTGGALAAGDAGIRLDGGTIPAGGSCTITVDVTAPTAGTYNNSIAAGNLLTSGGSNASAASAALTVLLRPTVAKSFNPSETLTGGTSVLTLTLTNPNGGVAITGTAFTDSYPANLVNTTAPGGATTCAGGTVTALAGGTSVALSGGTIAAGGSCTVTVNVTSATAGAYTNTIPAGGVTTTNAGSNTAAASATLTVSLPPLVTKVSAVISDPHNSTTNPKRIPGAVIEYSLTIDNSAGTVADTNIVATDVIPAGATYVAGSLTVNGVAEDDDNAGADETDPNGGDFNQTAANTVTARIGSIAAGASATVVFRVIVN